MLQRLETASRFQRSIASLVLGGMGCLAMAPYNVWPVLILSLSGFYLLIDRTTSARGAFFYGWLYGFGYFFCGLFWVKNALLVDGNPFSWVWPLAVAGLPSLMAFFTAAGSLAAKRFFNLKNAGGFVAFTAVIAASEWARGFVFTGFPWNLFGMAWSGTLPMVQNVAVGNVYFLTWLTVFWFALPGFWLLKAPAKKEKIKLSVFAVASFAICLGFGIWRLQIAEIKTVPDVNVHIVQPNISQSEKWDRTKTNGHFTKLVDLSRPDDETTEKTIIIWPETALNFWLTQDPAAMKYLTDMLKSYESGAVLLTGILRNDPGTKTYYNSLVMIDADGNMSNIYNKHHLVPFGEYIPFQKWIPLAPVVKFSGFAKGNGAATFEALGIKYSPVICYEIIFSGAVRGPEIPDLIVNVTNDAWYGVSAGPYQHFTQALFRAVEEGIPVARAANTGFSGMIDPFGHVQEKSELYSEYEKKLALPVINMVFRNHSYLKDVVFIALILLLAFWGYFRK